jgi:hypothetical protein
MLACSDMQERRAMAGGEDADRLTLDGQTFWSAIMVPLLCLVCAAFLIQFDPYQRWGPLVPPVFFLIGLGIAVIWISANLPLRHVLAGLVAGMIWAGGFGAALIALWAGAMAVGFAGIILLSPGRPLHLLLISAIGLLPIWSALGIFRRAFQYTRAIRSHQSFGTVLTLGLVGALVMIGAVMSGFLVRWPKKQPGRAETHGLASALLDVQQGPRTGPASGKWRGLE